MENTLNKMKVTTRQLTKQLIIAVCFSIGYFTLVRLNPFAALTGVASLAVFSNIRIAEILKAFALVSPGAVGGIAIGAYTFNVYSGKIAIGAYSAIPTMIMLVGLATCFISHTIGRSIKKDLSLLAVYGLLSGLIVSLNLVTIAVLFDSETWSNLFTAGALWKIAFNVALPLTGYPLVRLIERK
jgi:hypothetical protein